MIVAPPSLAHVRYVADHMRADDRAEFSAVSFTETDAALADHLVERYGAGQDVYCFSKDDAPVAVGAMVNGRPNVVTLMFFATDRFAELALPIARFVTRNLFPEYRAAGVHRIEAISMDGYDASHRWIELLGLRREGVFRGFGRAGESFHQFAWVADDVR